MKIITLVLIARTIQAILICLAIHFLNTRFNILPAGTTSAVLTIAAGVALSEFFFYFFNQRKQ
ncbi:hypothetical protein G3N57_14045 [Paraburkholderia sp. Se-20369]|nr:hypothetical protein [Paraburkholderia sp. Se-20369]